MADTGGGGNKEPVTARDYDMLPAIRLNVGTDEATTSINATAQAIGSLKAALQDFSSSAYMAVQSVNSQLRSIGETAAAATAHLNGMASAVGGALYSGGGGGGRGGGGGGGGGRSYGGGTGSSGWVSSAASAISSAGGTSGSGIPSPGTGLGAFLGNTGGAEGFLADAALAPLRWMRSRVNTNRETAIRASGGLNMAAIQSGATPTDVLGRLARFPGTIYGGPQELMDMYANAPRYGAAYNFGSGDSGVRGSGFYQGIRQMQMLNPSASVGQLTSDLGGYASNTNAQQRSMMLTGGAMGMIGAGGRQKSLSEWAESILRWFEGLRGGPMRNKPFKHGELMAQQFPGSNIDAWFEVNGVPQNMRDYWWTYALGKTAGGGTTQDTGFTIGAPQGNVAWERLRASTELTRTEFNLAGKMTPQYAMREASNRWFNELMGAFQMKVIPGISESSLGWIQYLPDPIEDLLMAGTERGIGALLGGDVGDIGDTYGEMGGTGTSGLHPDMKSKVGAMMRANPRLKMNSGLRDTGLQRRLKAKGHSRVSGKPSAHTRGMAADLGPRSEYGWISKNAGRFGLASGRGHGEPWHVGMKGTIPGVGDVDIGSPETGGGIFDLDPGVNGGQGAFATLIGALGGFENSPTGMASLVSALMNSVVGLLGGLLDGDGKQFATGPDDLYQQLATATKDTILGKGYRSMPGTRPGTGRGRGTLGSGGGGAGANFGGGVGGLPLPTGGGPGTQEAGIAAATALFNAGFTKKSDLETITAISWRESKWNPLAKNKWTSDRGLMQINMAAHKNTMNSMGYTEADLMDIQKNANIAHRLWVSGGGDMASFKQLWGFSENSPYSEPVAGRPGWDKNGDPLGRTQGSNAVDIVAASGLPVGDIEQMQAGMNTMSRAGGTRNTFNNVFQLSVPTYGAGGGGGIDLRRTVTLIADHLEDEMNRRQARSA